jgi:cell division septation protein DedD
MQDQENDRDFEPRARERRRERGPGLGLTLFGAALLTAVGFVLGIVVGASLEDPDLLVSSLAGRTQDVELGASAEPGAVAAAPPPLGVEAEAPSAQADFGGSPESVEQQVDAAALALEATPPAVAEAEPPLGANAPLPPPEKPAAAPKRSTPPRVAAARTGAGFAVQVGAFQDRPPAAALSDRLERSGFPAFVAGAEAGSGQRWRVRVGPVATRGEAEALARRLKREEGLPTWVVSDGR